MNLLGGSGAGGALVLLAFVVVMGGVWGLTQWVARKRRAQLAELAPSLGMEYSPRDDVTVTARLGRLPLFEKGRDRRACNVMRGTSNGRRVAVFDYHFRTGAGKHTHHHSQTVAHVRAEGVDLPLFWMRPHGMLDKLASLVGMRDIDFSDDEAFSKRWFLKAQDEEAARRLFTPRVRSQFAPDRPLHVEAGGPDLIVYREGKKADPEGIRALLEDAFRMTELFTRAGTPGRS